MLWLYGNGVY
jgi:hypothetical protein